MRAREARPVVAQGYEAVKRAKYAVPERYGRFKLLDCAGAFFYDGWAGDQ